MACLFLATIVAFMIPGSLVHQGDDFGRLILIIGQAALWLVTIASIRYLHLLSSCWGEGSGGKLKSRVYARDFLHVSKLHREYARVVMGGFGAFLMLNEIRLWSERVGSGEMSQFEINDAVAAALLNSVRSMWEEPNLDWKVGSGELFAHCRECTLRKSSRALPLLLFERLNQAIWWAFESIPVINGILLALQCSTRAKYLGITMGVLKVMSI